MAPFAGHAVRTAVHAAVDGDSAAAAGSENHRKHHVLAGSGTIGGFGNCKAVGVVGAPDFAREGAAQVFVEGFAIQP